MRMNCRWSMPRSPTNDDDLRAAPYRVLEDWARLYDGNLRVLPAGYFRHGAFSRRRAGLGRRLDRRAAGFKAAHRGRRGTDRLVARRGAAIRGETHRAFRWHDDRFDRGERPAFARAHARFRSAGAPVSPMISPAARRMERESILSRPSLVCKVIEVEGRPAVKLSDNPSKFLGPKDAIARYARVFGYTAGPARPA